MDVANDVQWRDGIVQAEWTSPPPYGVGSTGRHTHKEAGVFDWEVTRLRDGTSFEFVHTAGALKGSAAFFQVGPEAGGSRVNVQMRLSGPLLMRFLMFLMAGRMRKSVRGDLQKLKTLMEKQDANA